MEEILNIIKKSEQKGDKIIITSDQVIRWNGKIREKPNDENECREFLRGYKDHPAECVGSVVVHNTKTGVHILQSNQNRKTS